jgi:hypothetical protein
MAYQQHYQLADDVITHLNPVVATIADPFISTRYVGFVAVIAVTVYELAIKDIFIEFGYKKHKLLGSFTEKFFHRINGRIRLRDLNEAYIPKFGENMSEGLRKSLMRPNRQP